MRVHEQLIEDAVAGWARLAEVAVEPGSAIDGASERDCSTAVVLSGRMREVVRRPNPHLPDATIDAVVASLSRPPHPTLIENNRWFPIC